MANFDIAVSMYENPGDRSHHEDRSVTIYDCDENGHLKSAFFGLFDGHGGSEASEYAKNNLYRLFSSSKDFNSDDDEKVKRALYDAFVQTHYGMWSKHETWPRTSKGGLSIAGTTATVAFLRRNKLFVGHVGDSRIVLGVEENPNSPWTPCQLTTDHKPNNEIENARIYSQGGKVVQNGRVPRVVWNRPIHGRNARILRNTVTQEKACLAVARSLGDFWSYNPSNSTFIVSPYPDVSLVEVDCTRHRCLVLASDGLWDVQSSQQVVDEIYMNCNYSEMYGIQRDRLNHAKFLVGNALNVNARWKMRADNVSVISVTFHAKVNGINENQTATIVHHVINP